MLQQGCVRSHFLADGRGLYLPNSPCSDIVYTLAPEQVHGNLPFTVYTYIYIYSKYRVLSKTFVPFVGRSRFFIP